MLDDVPVRRPHGAGLRVEAQVVIARDDHLNTVWCIRLLIKINLMLKVYETRIALKNLAKT